MIGCKESIISASFKSRPETTASQIDSHLDATGKEEEEHYLYNNNAADLNCSSVPHISGKDLVEHKRVPDSFRQDIFDMQHKRSVLTRTYLIGFALKPYSQLRIIIPHEGQRIPSAWAGEEAHRQQQSLLVGRSSWWRSYGERNPFTFSRFK